LLWCSHTLLFHPGRRLHSHGRMATPSAAQSRLITPRCLTPGAPPSILLLDRGWVSLICTSLQGWEDSLRFSFVLSTMIRSPTAKLRQSGNDENCSTAIPRVHGIVRTPLDYVKVLDLLDSLPEMRRLRVVSRLEHIDGRLVVDPPTIQTTDRGWGTHSFFSCNT
jgi:hypothetical protein